MNRLFHTLRNIRSGGRAADTPRDDSDLSPDDEALLGFDNQIEVLCSYAERSAAYEDDLLGHLERIVEQLMQLQELMEKAIDDGEDRNALEYLRLAARLRPQRELLEQELRAFLMVATDLIGKVKTLVEYRDEARQFARDASLSPAATHVLTSTMNSLTRNFVLLERVTKARHQTLSERLGQQITTIIDDRELDLELATYILNRRRAIGPGTREEE
jgi:hypothetical protein